MRNRLDEIIESHIKVGCRAGYEELQAIAKECFRHGVEQAVFGGWAFGGIEGGRPGPCYRPAPAENIPDRRKVERRKP